MFLLRGCDQLTGKQILSCGYSHFCRLDSLCIGRVRPLRSLWAKGVGGCRIIFGEQRESSYSNGKTHVYVLESRAMEKKTQTQVLGLLSPPPSQESGFASFRTLPRKTKKLNIKMQLSGELLWCPKRRCLMPF